MTRHINLMRADILPGQGRIQLPAFLLALVLTLLSGLGYLGYHAVVAESLQQSIVSTQQEVDDSNLQLHRLRQSYPSIASETDLRASNEALQARLVARRSELQGLANQLDTAALGFSRPLASLAKHDLNGLWLTHIELRDSHSHLELQGMARQPGLIPRYLGQLEGAVFQGLSIRNLDIEQNNDELWQFSIAESLSILPAQRITPTTAPATNELPTTTLPEFTDKLPELLQ